MPYRYLIFINNLQIREIFYQVTDQGAVLAGK